MKQATNIFGVLGFAVLFFLTAAAQQASTVTSQTGKAACYSRRLVGHKTSSGERYDPNGLTAAHAHLPVGTRVKVINAQNGQAVVVRINDRLSAHAGGVIILDISRRACKELKVGPSGETEVKLEVVSSAGTKPN